MAGLCNTAATQCVSIRKFLKANKKIGGLVDDAVALLKNIEDLAHRSTVFLDVGSIDKMDFCVVADRELRRTARRRSSVSTGYGS